MKKSKLIKPTKDLKQSGQMKDMARDAQRLAMLPGLRKSKSGKHYWETRKNRSDKNKSKKI